MQGLLKLANDDYQNRSGEYPKSLIPDSIVVTSEDTRTTIEFDFKNTNDSEAIEWYEKSKESKTINKYKKAYDIDITTTQDGDYQDDWNKLTVTLSKKESTMIDTTPQEEAPLEKSVATGYAYCYILSTLEQRKAINLLEHKTQIEKVITNFFMERLLCVEILPDRYTLTLIDAYQVADKRRLGRLLSENTDLKQHVRKILYNNNQDSSGQLFRIKKQEEEL